MIELDALPRIFSSLYNNYMKRSIITSMLLRLVLVFLSPALLAGGCLPSRFNDKCYPLVTLDYYAYGLAIIVFLLSVIVLLLSLRSSKSKQRASLVRWMKYGDKRRGAGRGNVSLHVRSSDDVYTAWMILLEAMAASTIIIYAVVRLFLTNESISFSVWLLFALLLLSPLAYVTTLSAFRAAIKIYNIEVHGPLS